MTEPAPLSLRKYLSVFLLLFWFFTRFLFFFTGWWTLLTAWWFSLLLSLCSLLIFIQINFLSRWRANNFGLVSFVDGHMNVICSFLWLILIHFFLSSKAPLNSSFKHTFVRVILPRVIRNFCYNSISFIYYFGFFRKALLLRAFQKSWDIADRIHSIFISGTILKSQRVASIFGAWEYSRSTQPCFKMKMSMPFVVAIWVFY